VTLENDVHDVGITLDDHLLGQLHRADFRDAAGVVAAQVDQHQVLGDFLGIGQQVCFQRQILLFGGAARAGAGDGPHGDQVVLDAHQHFR